MKSDSLDELVAKLQRAEVRGTTAWLLPRGAPIKLTKLAAHSVPVVPCLTVKLKGRDG
jgi:hypothetical protein